jgi:hypothetical protein
MKHESLYSELGLALARGDVGLWVGPDGVPLADASIQPIAAQEWLGVWAESRQIEFARAIETTWRERSSARMLIEVPDLVEDALGEHFKFSDFCPYFYLNGKGGGADRLSPLRREDTKRDKARYLEDLGASVLLICGYQKPARLAPLLDREIGEYGAKLRLVVIAGCSEEALQQLKSSLSARQTDLAAKIFATDDAPDRLLRAIEDSKAALPTEPTILVGNISVRLRALLRTQPPIDQDFLIVTEQDVRRPEAQEDKTQMLADLLAGRQPPWRAFAHGLAWKRGSAHLNSVLDGLERMRKDDLAVYCIDIPVEPGAGATVLLQHVAFESARRGYPCLMHRSFGSELNYDLLRRFLTDLQHEAGAAKGSPPPIAVLVFDTPSVEGDSKSLLQDLPPRLTRDGRRALVVRSVPVRRIAEANDAGFKRNYEMRTRGGVVQEWLPPLAASLTGQEQNALADWAAKHFEQVGQRLSEASLETIRNWNLEEQQVPLLICLYFILTDEFRAKAGLGKHLIDRLKKLLPDLPSPEAANSEADARPMTRAELLAAFGEPGTLAPRFSAHAVASRDDVAAVFIALAALGSLRLGAPRDVLDAIAGVEREKVHSAIASLEKNDLALTDLPVDGETGEAGEFKKRRDDRLAPLAFYTVKETVGLRHPAYGRLVFDWLRSPGGWDDRQLLASKGQPAAFLRCSEWGQTDIERRFRLLEPILQALKPNAPQAKFAAELSVRFLRLQKRESREARSEMNQFQWQKPQLLREAFSWLNESVVRQSAVTLHSRGITRYKTCFPNLAMEECRQRYKQAVVDLELALELARRDQSSEHPGNIITSLGLLYLGWAERARQEGQRPGGTDEEWRSVDSRVEKTLRDGLRERRDNPYAACGLARYLLERCKRVLRSEVVASPAQQAACGQDLSEALELLQIEPEAYFATEWNELWRLAIALLSDAEAKLIIAGLKASGDELGFALECMKALEGRIPTEPTQDSQSVQTFEDANRILLEATTYAIAKKCPLADLLRYALFSADAERLTEPAYAQRFKLLEPLQGTRYLDQPIWRFDHAMLAFQVGRYHEGAESFAWLRKNARFFEVPKERSQLLAESPSTLRPMRVTFRIVVTGAEGERGSGRVEQPVRFRDPVPFSSRAFMSRGKGVAPGTVTSCFIRLNPAGPFAEPESR